MGKGVFRDSPAEIEGRESVQLAAKPTYRLLSPTHSPRFQRTPSRL